LVLTWLVCLLAACCVLCVLHAVCCMLLPAGFKKVGTPALLESVGVSSDAAMTKMRLMALLMLGSKASGSPVAFTDIQAALDITPEQVRRVLGRRVLGHTRQVYRVLGHARAGGAGFSGSQGVG
jgi:hypothetical protein